MCVYMFLYIGQLLTSSDAPTTHGAIELEKRYGNIKLYLYIGLYTDI